MVNCVTCNRVGSSLKMLECYDLCNKGPLRSFLLTCQTKVQSFWTLLWSFCWSDNCFVDECYAPWLIVSDIGEVIVLYLWEEPYKVLTYDCTVTCLPWSKSTWTGAAYVFALCIFFGVVLQLARSSVLIWFKLEWWTLLCVFWFT